METLDTHKGKFQTVYLRVYLSLSEKGDIKFKLAWGSV